MRPTALENNYKDEELNEQIDKLLVLLRLIDGEVAEGGESQLSSTPSRISQIA
jgi:hypothetical protein